MTMTCTWEPDESCLPDNWAGDPEAEGTAALKERSLMLATSALQMLTLNRVGTCPVTIRPCPEPLPCGKGWEPYLVNGQWLNTCGCRNAHWCKPLSEVDLPGPVGYIESIKVDGVGIETDDFRLDDGHLLVWEGTGISPIPETQDLNKPDTEVGTWSITYSRSYPVNQEGRIAVALLAKEFAEACKPKGKCSLPRGVTNVVRNGVTFTVDAGMFINGLTGIQVVDSYILQWAPAGAPQRSATVFDPRSLRGGKARVTNRVPVRDSQPGFGDGGFGL